MEKIRIYENDIETHSKKKEYLVVILFIANKMMLGVKKELKKSLVENDFIQDKFCSEKKVEFSF